MSGLPKVSFTLGSGGLLRPLTGFDHYSAMIAYDYGSAATSGYSALGNTTFSSIEDAEAAGIVNTCDEATAASAIQTVSAVGANGDVVTVTREDWNGTDITLGSYTKVTADNTVTLVATAIVAAINALTYQHGFSAVVGVAGAYTITAPKTWGTYLNTKSVTNTITGTLAITNNAFSGGTKSKLAMYHYQISEFFRGNPLGILYFAIKFDDSATAASVFNAQVQTDGLEICNKFKGQARQFLFYNPFRTFATSTLTALKALRTTLFNQYTPAEVLYVGGYAGTLAAQANTRALAADGVAAVIGQSGTGVGFDYYNTQQAVIGQGGLALGVLSVCAVSQDIAEVAAFNVSDGSECETASFFEGSNYEDVAAATLDQLHDYGYIFLRKYAGNYPGTYFNKANAAVSPASDFAYLYNSRTINKAVRNVYQSIVSLLNKRNLLNADGTLSEVAIADYNEKADSALSQMQRDGDVSDYSISVSRSEVVSSTSNIPITINIVPVGVTNTISITIGFTATL